MDRKILLNSLLRNTSKAMTNKQTIIQEAKKEFEEYMSQGYSGGADGLRCDNCDNKYSGESGIKQLCPMCKFETLITNTLTARDKEVEEIVNNATVYTGGGSVEEKDHRINKAELLSALNNKAYE